jgi:hypothetical protein
MAKIGRNDPCPCGSGKKYKHCCMHKVQSTRRVERGQIDQVNQIRYLAKQVIPQLPDDEAQKLQDNLDRVEELAAYDAMAGQIETAGRVLEAHRAEFENLLSDPPTAMERAQRLFSEERFASLRYTTQDVHRAFEEVGYPSRFKQMPNDEDMEILVQATVHLAGDKDDRVRVVRQLMLALPEYVAAGRYLDGWLIRYSAYRMVEVPQESNPFLFAMFDLAYNEWANQMDSEQEALLAMMDFRPSDVAGKDVEEVEALLRAQFADPKKKATLEAYYEAHPMLRGMAEAETWDLQLESVQLLERDDADCLYLIQEETEPWVPVLLERLKPVEARAREAAARGEWDDRETLDEMSQTMAEVAREMARSIFTPERIRRLVADLKAYRRALLEKQEEKAANLAHATWMPLDREDIETVDPAEMPLLTSICFASLREMMIVLSREAQAKTSR